MIKGRIFPSTLLAIPAVLNGTADRPWFWHPRQMNDTAPGRPKPARDCLDCGRANTMKLQHALGTQPKGIPLLYVCYACGTALKIPAATLQP